MRYTELQVTSNFSFLKGASHPEELIDQAATFGYSKIAITDVNTLAGIVRAHIATRKHNIKLIPACRLDLINGPSLLAYPTDKLAYERLSSLLSKGNLRAEKGKCFLYKEDVFEFQKGIIFIAIPPNELNKQYEFELDFKKDLKIYKEALGRSLYLATNRIYQGQDQKRLFRLNELSQEINIPLVATNDVYYHHPDRRELQDILTCVREKCTIQTAGFRLFQNAERHLKPIEEMNRLFFLYPDALRRSEEIAERCQFSLDSLEYNYPDEITTEGRTPFEELEYQTWKGAKEIFGEPLPEKIINNIHHEMKFVKEMNYASYFLTVYDIVCFARKQKILCQGRGSAANSTICYCLGITSVDPNKFDLLFERFISSARNEPPDIDVDFEHERREEVIQYIYNKYGRDRAAIVATVTQLHQKGAVRDVAKAMGLSLDTINRLSSSLWELNEDWLTGNKVSDQGFNPKDPQLLKVLDLTRQMVGFPRQLGQHTGGFIITKGTLTQLCPILHARMDNRTNIEWNKDDIEALGFLKVDILALGMLTCIRKAFDLAKQHYNLDLSLAKINQNDDPKVYDMISLADTIGVFQIESRAQQSMLPRLKPRNFYDLVIEVAIVRPGPIQGDMVHPYLRRRNGEELVEYPTKELEKILKTTLGVPLFQEQAMKIAIVAAGFTPSEADELRRSMATFKAKGLVSKFKKKLISGMIAKGYKEEFAERIFRQLEGFGSYGFPESHATSFALLVYVSCWLKCYYPDIFAAAILNSLPMGFYQPAQLVIDAQKHGVTVREVDINYSHWDHILEEKANNYHALRLGFRQIKGIREDEIQSLIANRSTGYNNIHSLLDIGVSITTLERLADADAFRSMNFDRRQALWEISALHDRPIALFKDEVQQSNFEGQIELPLMSKGEHIVQDYASLSLSVKAHPLHFLREKLNLLHNKSSEEIKQIPAGSKLKTAGLVLVKQRPGTAAGVCFITLEDETGISNLVVFERTFKQYRKEILNSKLLMVEGKLQREGQVVHIIVQKCTNLNKLLKGLNYSDHEDPSTPPFFTPNKNNQSNSNSSHKTTPSAEKVFHEGRNFK